MRESINNQITESINVKQAALKDEQLLTTTESVITRIVEAFKNGNKVMLAGNGGSASQALHMSGEFVNKFRHDRKALPSLALSADISNITSIGNDSGFDFIFSRQIEALGKDGDVLIVLTTSDADKNPGGHSANLHHALEGARKLGIITVGMVSAKTKNLLPLLDHALIVPSSDTPRVQEVHGLLIHIICEEVEKQCL